MAGAVVSLQVFREGIIKARGTESSFKILQLRRIAYFHKAKDIRMDCPDHPGYGLLFPQGFARICPESPVDSPGHGEIVLNIVTGHPDLIRLPGCKNRIGEKQSDQNGAPEDTGA